jgi:hypothetical protein
MTIMHSTANTGRLMLGTDYKDIESDHRSSVLTDLAVWDVDADGGFRAVSGTTVKMELTPAGLYTGTSKFFDSDKGYSVNTQRVTTVAAATTGLAVTSADSGTLYVISSNNTTMQISLTATPGVGNFFDFFNQSSAAGDITVMTEASGDNQGFLFYQSTGDFLSTAGITNETSGIMYFRVIALTSGSLWAVQNLWYGDYTTTIYGGIGAASTTT